MEKTTWRKGQKRFSVIADTLCAWHRVPLPVREELRVQQTSVKTCYWRRDIPNTPEKSLSVLPYSTLWSKMWTRPPRPWSPLTPLRKWRTTLSRNLLAKSSPQTPHSTGSNSQSQEQQQHHKLLQLRKLRGSAADAPGSPYSWSSLQAGDSVGLQAREIRSIASSKREVLM